MKIKKIMTGVFALLMLFAASCGFAESGIRMEGQIGFDGVVAQGSAWRLTLKIRNDSAQDIDGNISVNVPQDLDSYNEVQLPIKLDAGENGTYKMDIFPRVPQKMLDIRLISSEGNVLAFTTIFITKAIETDHMVIGVWGESKLANALESHDRVDQYGREENVSTILLDTQDFPENKAEADAFSLLFIDDHRWDELAQDQQKTLIAWMKDGGYLILGTDDGNILSDWKEALTMRTDAQNMAVTTNVQNILTHAAETEEESEILKNVELLTHSHAIVCNFSLCEDFLLRAEENEQIWRQVLTALNGEGYTFNNSGRDNAQFSESLNMKERVDRGKSILSAACILSLYVLLIGIGLYVFFGRKGLSRWMWAAIPLCAVTCSAVLGLWGAIKKINAPAATQMLVISYDEDGDVTTEEQALVSYAGQKRKTISTEDGAEIEKRGYQSFYTYGEENTDVSKMKLQNAITLGEHASFELESQATWLSRSLLIHSRKEPEGEILSSAWMERDGLHVKIENQTDVTLKNAVLLSSLGYKHVEQLNAGETVEIFLPRQQESRYSANDDIGVLIPEGEALLFPASIYTSIYFCTYPEKAEEQELHLSDEESEKRSLLDSKLSLAVNQKGWFNCVLVAECPEISCSQLLLDGEPIANTVQNTIVICSIPLQSESENGYLYAGYSGWDGPIVYDIDTGEDGTLSLGRKKDGSYFYDEKNSECLMGYDLSDVDYTKIETIRIENIYWKMDRGFNDPMEVYDHEKHKWIVIPSSGSKNTDISLDVRKMGGVISKNGELFLRIQISNMQNYGGVPFPTITVEGGQVDDSL